MISLVKINDNEIYLIDCTISCYKHNIYIMSSNTNDIFNILLKIKYDNILNNEIQILTDKILYIINNSIIQDVVLLKNKLHLNIIGESINIYSDPTLFIRSNKMKKIINNINEKNL